MVAAAAVEGTNDEEAGVLALGAGVGLKGDGGEAGDLFEGAGEAVEEDAVAGGLFGGREGVEAAEFGPSDGEHFGGGVKLHCAGAERDHRVGEGEVAVLQPGDVAEHFGLRLHGVEDWVGEERAGAGEGGAGSPG